MGEGVEAVARLTSVALGYLTFVRGQLAARNPNTRLVIDHLGLNQPFEPPAPPDDWADLPKLLTLAAHPNVVVKISGACTLSHEAFPYKDIWDPLFRVFDAFGLNRCM
jgi:predicted TIM-barrel fold metal-dependent hydrolase